MWFFDTVLEDTSKTTAVASAAAIKKDEQDGSFLIVDDSGKVEDIPDTAVQLFDSSKQEATPEAEISFFSEPVVSTTTESSPEISFFSEPVGTEVEPIVSLVEKAAETESSVILMEDAPVEATEEIIAPVVEDTPVEAVQEVQFFAPAEIVAEPVTTVVVPEKNDIYAPLKKAIAEYDAILAAHMQIAASKDAEITDYNNQVAAAKAAAKKALEERKALETEMDRVKQMKELFSAQLK